jgi:VanZ family protein
MVCVGIGSLSPGESPLMGAVSRRHINDKVLHFCAYVVLSSLPVVGFRNRWKGIVAGLLMFVLGSLLEVAQHFSPGRTADLGDAVANGAGVGCGVVLGSFIGKLIALF